MQKYGGAVIRMQQILNNVSEENKVILSRVTFLVGDENRALNASNISARVPFDDTVVEFLNSISQKIRNVKNIREYPDVVTWGFWIRKSSILAIKKRFINHKEHIRLGRGCVFHIAPSNVPVNYAYSLVVGLLTGNTNIVRIPSKDFPQVEIINNLIKEALNEFEEIKPYICLVRYGRDKRVNDLFSKIADSRVIWGGDLTIEEIRKSPLTARANEITFADRYSIAVIDSEMYMQENQKEKIAESFYNDTYLTDQNACTSPRIVIWIGKEIENAKGLFWKELKKIVEAKYNFQPIMSINKLTNSYLAAINQPDVKIEKAEDNLIVRMRVNSITNELMNFKGNSGFFFEYDCKDILDLKILCDNKQCQTIAYLGNTVELMPLLSSGIKGIDRVVPIGKTMDFDMIWDGYNLFESLTRIIKIDI